LRKPHRVFFLNPQTWETKRSSKKKGGKGKRETEMVRPPFGTSKKKKGPGYC